MSWHSVTCWHMPVTQRRKSQRAFHIFCAIRVRREILDRTRLLCTVLRSVWRAAADILTNGFISQGAYASFAGP